MSVGSVCSLGVCLVLALAVGCGSLAWDKDDGFTHRAAAKDIREAVQPPCPPGQHLASNPHCKPTPDNPCRKTCVTDP